MADIVPAYGVPPSTIRSQLLDDGTLVVWDDSDRSTAWIHGRPVPVRE